MNENAILKENTTNKLQKNTKINPNQDTNNCNSLTNTNIKLVTTNITDTNSKGYIKLKNKIEKLIDDSS
jgi:hypothetical protein